MSKRKIDFKKIALAFLLIVITSSFITSFFIALPKTEKFSPQYTFTLRNKEKSYAKASFIIRVEIGDKDENTARLKIEQSKNIIQRRLNRYGVEFSSIKKSSYIEATTPTDEEDSSAKVEFLEVSVETSKPIDQVKTLISNRYYMRILTPRDDVDFTTDSIAQYLPENYNKTNFTRRSFRNIHIASLPTTSGVEAYFSVYKPWPHKSVEFRRFLERHAGEAIGISVDGFVTQYTVPYEFLDATISTTQRTTMPDFAPPIAQTADQAEIVDILMNSGVIPYKYQLVETNEEKPEPFTLDYLEAMLALIVGLVLVSVFAGVRNNSERSTHIKFLITTASLLVLYVAGLKLFEVAVDMPLLAIELLIAAYLVKMLIYHPADRTMLYIGVYAFGAVSYLLGSGMVEIFAKDLLLLATMSLILSPIVQFYISNMRKLILK